MARQLLILFSVLTTWTFSTGQHSPYSLQSAVDALHRREQQLALKENYDPSIRFPSSLDDPSYWNGQNEIDQDLPPYRGNRQQLNKLLASYLAREEEQRENSNYPSDYDEDDFRPDEKKRSIFRERDELPYQSVFREREMEVQPDLSDDFLREIDHERNLEREEKYRDTLRRLWEKYQQQENEIEEELFDEEERKKKRSEISPMYYGPVMAKKSYPVLPWLPASRKKRFPVAKRSPKEFEVNINVSGTNDKVSKDLDEIFGQPIDEKKKRSSNDNLLKKKREEPNDDKKRAEKKSEHVPDDENDEEEHEENEDHHHEEEDEHDHHHDEDEDDDHDFDDSEEDDDKKKKRATHKKKRSNLEIVKEDQIIPGDLTDFKKKKSSFQWSKYFGMDRRKKSSGWLEKKKKKSYDHEYPLHNFRNHDEPEDRKKKDYSDDKLQNMDDKLKTIEELIIDETVKYTGAHEGVSNPEEIRKLKDHVVSRLATAYSLEKMRRALEKLKQNADDEHHLNHNEIESDDSEEKKKRVAIKKEKAEFDNNHHKIEANNEKVTSEEPANALEDSDDDKKKKKKKKSEFPVFSNDVNDFEEELGAGHFVEPMSEGYMGGKDFDGPNECPLLDTIEKRCRGVDLLSGDIHQELLPICGFHQLCYLCGTTQTACDFQYLSQADSICGHNTECQSAARSALMILRGAPNPQLGPKECSKNECLYRAMREVGL